MGLTWVNHYPCILHTWVIIYSSMCNNWVSHYHLSHTAPPKKNSSLNAVIPHGAENNIFVFHILLLCRNGRRFVSVWLRKQLRVRQVPPTHPPQHVVVREKISIEDIRQSENRLKMINLRIRGKSLPKMKMNSKMNNF